MIKLVREQKQKLCAGFAATPKLYPWNTALYLGFLGQSLNGVLGLINQLVYHFNPNPKYRTPNVFNDSSSKIYIRAAKNALGSTISFGSPFI